MDRGGATQGPGNPGEIVDSYFHPPPGSLSPVRTWRVIEIERKYASSTRKLQSHLANPGEKRYESASGLAGLGNLDRHAQKSKSDSNPVVIIMPLSGSGMTAVGTNK